jgi:hypothetical protein
LIIEESGTPGEWDDMHAWSKLAGGEGVMMLLGAGVSRAASAVDEAGACANWVAKFVKGGCFVEGTLVTVSELPYSAERQEAIWSEGTSWADDLAGAATALLAEPGFLVVTKQHLQIPIEQVPLGARIPTKNPRPWEYDDSLPEPDQATWAKVSVTMYRNDGGIVDAELIRPRWWIAQHGIQTGQHLPMHIEELQVQGSALVTAVEDCPEIASGEGSVVTARFLTRQVDVIARVEILGPDGQIETLEGTTIHPVWSEDRQDWVPLGELQQGEAIRAASGPALILSVAIHSISVPVYNIEVHGEHVYQVGRIEMLVHNGTAFRCMDLDQFTDAARGLYKDTPFTDHPGHHFVWDNLNSARMWADDMIAAGDEQIITQIETRLDLSSYTNFHHPPHGQAYLVPFEHLGKALKVILGN